MRGPILHGVKAGSHALAVRWIVRRRGEAAQLGLFKREMDRGSEQGTNIALQQAHESASIHTPPKPPSHPSVPYCIYFLLSSHAIPFSPTCLRHICKWDSAVALSTRGVTHLSWPSISCCIFTEHAGTGGVQRGGQATGGCVGGQQKVRQFGLLSLGVVCKLGRGYHNPFLDLTVFSLSSQGAALPSTLPDFGLHPSYVHSFLFDECPHVKKPS